MKLVARHIKTASQLALTQLPPESRVLTIAFPCQQELTDFNPHWELVKTSPLIEWYTQSIVGYCVREGINHIQLTYTEPFLYPEEVISLAEACHSSGVALHATTYGLGVTEVKEKVVSALDSVTVYLFSVDDRFFHKHLSYSRAAVENTITICAREAAQWQLSSVVIPGENDHLSMWQRMGSWVLSLSPVVAWHLWPFYNDYKVMDKQVTPPEALHTVADLLRGLGFRAVYTHSPR